MFDTLDTVTSDNGGIKKELLSLQKETKNSIDPKKKFKELEKKIPPMLMFQITA